MPPRIFLEKGYLLTISVKKEEDEALLEALFSLGERAMEKVRRKDYGKRRL
jgi:hypothetical protein